MQLAELEPKLLEEGCNKARFAVGERGAADDAFCIVQENGRWDVFYTERGNDSPPIFSSLSEEEACDFFYKYVLTLQHWHLVGWFVEEAGAVELEQRLRRLGTKPIRNDIPSYRYDGDRRYRVFVAGKDIFAVRNAVPDLPIQKE